MREIPLFDLNYGPEETSAVTDTLKSRWISMGPKCAGLEERFAEMLHVKYACAVTSCTAALHLACCALGLQSGDEVICPSLTFPGPAFPARICHWLVRWAVSMRREADLYGNGCVF